jgi:Rrf2 family protein
MRMSAGVEWALHSCLNLTWAEPGETVTATKLAAFYGLPAAYLNKQLQALSRAGVLASTSGPRGGFRLARRPEDITLLDVVTAIEGSEEAFRCTEIMGRSPDGRADVDYRKTCMISQSMRRAELAWRKELAGQTIAGLRDALERKYPYVPERTRHHLANL